MIKIHFILVCEGTSDRGLVAHLESLCVGGGAAEVSGTAPDLDALPRPPGRGVAAKVGAALELEPDANLVFVHRDSDSADSTRRYDEISHGMVGIVARYVAVVPVQETEAWLLLDEQALREVAGNPRGKVPLSLPKASRIEAVANPKEVLEAALIAASELVGRRLKKFRRQLPRARDLLLRRLDPDGPITSVPAWERLRRDIAAAISDLRHDAQGGGHTVDGE